MKAVKRRPKLKSSYELLCPDNPIRISDERFLQIYFYGVYNRKPTRRPKKDERKFNLNRSKRKYPIKYEL